MTGGGAVEGGLGVDVDNLSRSLCRQIGPGEKLGGQEGPGEVDIQGMLPIGKGNILTLALGEDSGIVD